ncbi:hypothetical protein [Planomonospora parontospora]|uniref:hypothetical protein n=1 Tax=Planomonospora parontospora TaxID=58119 RepID=UPI00166FEB40|nr:hypothetical protein [Planomonospora parontospora]GGL55317.1 hypothetical protein GCM10014719_65750 [Planomonospora parontospora subsp. antibiotica]GII19801.1 hypothetical protein Ppa05_65270 [Planomonospora parontospora subsp. antibiotica]
MGGAAERLLQEWGTTIELNFARMPDTGKVHVVFPEPPRWAQDDGEPIGTAADAALTARTPMVCGLKLRLEAQGGRGLFLATFPDEQLCARCVKGLGRHSVRAFEHPQPETDHDGA